MTVDPHLAGRTARAGLGVLLLLLTYRVGVGWWDIGAAALALPAVSVITAAAATRLTPDLAHHIDSDGSSWSRPAAVASTAVLIAVTGLGTVMTFVSPVDGGALYLFFGVSMLVAAAAGYRGCEVMALPNLLLRRSDQIWCWLFSPVEDRGGR